MEYGHSAAGDSYIAEPDPEGWKEVLYIIHGELTLEIEGQFKILGPEYSFYFFQLYFVLIS